MSLFGKSKPTASFFERRAAWARFRGEHHQPRAQGYYARLIEKEKLQPEIAPIRDENHEETVLLRHILSL